MVNRMGRRSASWFQILSVVSSWSLSAQCGQEKEKLQIIKILGLRNPSPASTKPRSKKTPSFLLEQARRRLILLVRKPNRRSLSIGITFRKRILRVYSLLIA